MQVVLALAVVMLHDGVAVRLVARSNVPIGFQIAAAKLEAHWLHGAGHF